MLCAQVIALGASDLPPPACVWGALWGWVGEPCEQRWDGRVHDKEGAPLGRPASWGCMPLPRMRRAPFAPVAREGATHPPTTANDRKLPLRCLAHPHAPEQPGPSPSDGPPGLARWGRARSHARPGPAFAHSS